MTSLLTYLSKQSTNIRTPIKIALRKRQNLLKRPLITQGLLVSIKQKH